MSRVTTPPLAKPVAQTASTTSSTTAKIPHDRIAMRAYEKWVQRGRPQGTSVQDWIEAEAELAKEVSSTTSAPATATAANKMRR